MSVSRPSLRRPLLLVTAPTAWLDDQEPAAVVFISDPERSSAMPSILLERLYGLTPAEATDRANC